MQTPAWQPNPGLQIGSQAPGAAGRAGTGAAVPAEVGEPGTRVKTMPREMIPNPLTSVATTSPPAAQTSGRTSFVKSTGF
jgi:hypothetical protein